ncbi:aminoglycoside phosphotransferase family protein [Acrocarpospora sp. B8E8]|uniref:phosphotransferase family protein n=1 Tax=Acrocarpospora sp. B8E8 TaxID=3153572 RepID=UPI00325D7A00
MSGVPAELAALASALGIVRLAPLSGGIEFLAFRGTGPEGEDLVVRMPRARTFHTANNVGVEALLLLDQEQRLAEWLSPQGFPVAEVLGRHQTGTGLPVLISRFIDSDAGDPDWASVGALLATLHALPAPEPGPVLQYGMSLPELIAKRLPERFRRLQALQPDLGGLPSPAAIARRLAVVPARHALLHLDVRRQNLLCRGGLVRAVIDWSNALVGDPRMELARMSEYARIPENGLDEALIRKGYAAGLPEEGVADCLYRLDAAVMLALVFLSVAPRPDLAPAQTARVAELLMTLGAGWH